MRGPSESRVECNAGPAHADLNYDYCAERINI